MTIIAVYVDDLILITKTAEEMQEVKNSLTTRFKRYGKTPLLHMLGLSII